MPFKSDKQRRYLWSQKPEVAKQIAYKEGGGGVYSSGLSDNAASWWNKRMAGIPQHRGYADDPDEITEAIGQNPDDRITYNNPGLINPNVKRPMHYVDMATYYTPGERAMGRDEKELARMSINNERIKREAAKRGFKFNEGGGVPAMDNRKPKKVTQKDRYGNQVTVEYADEIKPLDQTELMKHMMDGVPPMPMPMEDVGVSIGDMNTHPGEPRGTDTIPAWLTPGEFVVNAEAMSIPENAATVEAINNQGRAMQNGGPVYLDEGGWLSNLKKLMSGGYEEGDVETITPPMPEAPVEMEAPMPGSLPMMPDEALLRAREGNRNDVYIDSRGYPTVGIGHRLPDRFANRVGQEFSDSQVDRWFADDMDTARKDAADNIGKETWDKLNRRQKAAMTSMAFQLGKGKQAEFEKMITAMQDGDWEGVRREAKDSNWYSQTPKRVEDVVAAFRSDGGIIPAPGVSNPETDLPGPIYAFAGVDTSDPMTFMGDEWAQPIIDQEVAAAAPQGNYAEVPMTDEIPDVDADMSSGWTPPAMAMPDESSAEIPEGGSNVWDDFLAWAGDTSVADERNAAFNVKVEEANVAAAEADLAEMKEAQADPGMGVGPSDEAIAAQEEVVAHQKSKLADAEVEKSAHDGTLFEMQDDLVEQNQPGVEDDIETLEIAAKDPVGETEDNPSKESEKGQQSVDEVLEAGKKMGSEALDKAKGFFKGAFSDLFDGKELARMAMMYVGSRALGYSHHGSLNWAAKNYLGRLDAKEDRIQKLAESGKYTTESIEAYKKSGNVADLLQVGVPVSPLGNFKTFYGPDGKQVRAQEFKQGDARVWRTGDGKLVDASYHEDAKMAPGTSEYRTHVADQAKGYSAIVTDLQKLGKANDDKFMVKMSPELQGRNIAKWAIDNNVDPTVMGEVVQQAYEAARADGKDRINDITPYLNDTFIKAKVGSTNAELFKGASPIKVNATLTAPVQQLMAQDSTLTESAAQSKFIAAMNAQWNKLPEDQRKEYNDSADGGYSGFLLYVKDRIADSTT